MQRTYPEPHRLLAVLKELTPLHNTVRASGKQTIQRPAGLVYIDGMFRKTEHLLTLDRTVAVTPKIVARDAASSAAGAASTSDDECGDNISLSSLTPSLNPTGEILDHISIHSQESFVEVPGTEIPEGWLLLGPTQVEPTAARRPGH